MYVWIKRTSQQRREKSQQRREKLLDGRETRFQRNNVFYLLKVAVASSAKSLKSLFSQSSGYFDFA